MFVKTMAIDISLYIFIQMDAVAFCALDNTGMQIHTKPGTKQKCAL